MRVRSFKKIILFGWLVWVLAMCHGLFVVAQAFAWATWDELCDHQVGGHGHMRIAMFILTRLMQSIEAQYKLLYDEIANGS